MPFSFLNGLSAMGQAVSQFAGQAGLEAQKSDLAQAQMRLADSLATTRETGLETLRQTGAASLENTRQGGENQRSQNLIAANVALENLRESGANMRNAATIGGENQRSQNQIEAAEHRTELEVGKPSSEVQIAHIIAGPDATPEQLQDAAQTVIAGRSKYSFTPATQVDPNDSSKVISGVNRQNTRTGDIEFVPTGTNPNKGQPAAPTLSDASQQQLAEQVAAGDNSGLSGLGYGNVGAANRAAVREKVTQILAGKGLGGADLAAKRAEYMGETAGSRTAGTREANVSMAVNEAKLFMPLALDASEKVDRTQYPTLNSFLQSAEKGTGNEDVVRLAVATNSLVNAYSRAVTPSGIPTEGNQARARELLDQAWSKGQYRAAVDQLWKEMQAAQQSPIQTREEQHVRISGHPGSQSATSPAATSPAATSPAATSPAPGAGASSGSSSGTTAPAQSQSAVDPIAAARDAIARGASRDKVIERLRQNGIDPSRLFASPSSAAAPMPGQE